MMTPDERANRIVEMLKRRRQEFGMTQQEVADQIENWRQARVSEFEQAKNPSIKSTMRYARALGIEFVLTKSEWCFEM